MSMRSRQWMALAGVAVAAVFVTAAPWATVQSKPQVDLSKVSPTKAAFLEREAKEEEDARSKPIPPRGVHKPIPTPRILAMPGEGPSRRQAGKGVIIETGQSPFPAAAYDFQNRWVLSQPGIDIVVIAGSEREDKSQGVVAVLEVPKGKSLGEGRATIYRSAEKIGQFRVESASDMRLTLNTPSGKQTFFDASTRAFGKP